MGPKLQRKFNWQYTDFKERPTQGTHATGRGASRNRSHASPGMSHASQGRNNPSDSDRRDVPNTEPLSGGDDTQAGH